MTLLLCLYLSGYDHVDAETKSLIKQAVERSLANSSNRLIINVVNLAESAFDWHQIQALLCTLYVTQLTTSYAANAPLFDCTIVFDAWCGYNLALEPDLTTVFVSIQEEHRLTSWIEQRKQAGLPALTVEPLSTDSAAGDKQSIPGTGRLQPLFKRVAVGGTFDHIHAGHKILLTMTALLATESVVVGVTDDSMLKSKKFREYIAPTQDRIDNAQKLLQIIKRNITYEVVAISDPFGPTITDASIEALVCSKETEKGGEAVNHERARRGYPSLEIRLIDIISSDSPSVQGQDMATLKVSSTWIREYLSRTNKIRIN